MHGRRRNGEKLAGLKAEIEAAGGTFAGQTLDAGVDTAFVRERIAEALANLQPDTLICPAAIGEAYWQLHCQTRDAWTHELDIRPFGETW